MLTQAMIEQDILPGQNRPQSPGIVIIPNLLLLAS